MKTIDLFGNEVEIKEKNGVVPARTKTGSFKSNPLMLVYGKLEGNKCKHCTHLLRKKLSSTYYKCKLRNDWKSSSPKSDHRVNWDACGKFELDK